MNDIVNSARSWIGTKFLHQGRRKISTINSTIDKGEIDKGGVDCLGLLIGIAKELKLRSRQGQLLHECDSLNYSKSPDGYALQNKLEHHLISIRQLSEGAIILFKLDNNPQHLAIISDYVNGGFGIIHAFAPARCVTEHSLNEYWRSKIVGIYKV